MIYLWAHILGAVVLFQILKYAQVRKAAMLPLIVVNYAIAAVATYAMMFIHDTTFLEMPTSVVIYGIIVGILYALHLGVMLLCIEAVGVGISATAASVSAVVPVIFAWMVWDESLQFWDICGLSIAPVSLYLCRVVDVKGISGDYSLHKWYKNGNVLLFLNFSMAAFNGVMHKVVGEIKIENIQESYQCILFLSATVITAICLFIKRPQFSFQACAIGSLFGTINFSTTACGLLALAVLPVVTVFPVAACSIIVLSTFVSWILWGERIIYRQTVGILLAIIAIVLISI